MLANAFGSALLYFIALLLLEIRQRHARSSYGLKNSLARFIFFSLALLGYRFAMGISWLYFFVELAFFYFFWAYYMIVLVNSENSFSLGVLQFIKKSPRQNVTRTDLIQNFNIDSSITLRLKAMQDGGLIKENIDNSYSLQSKGKLIAMISHIVIKIFGIQNKG